MTGIEAREYWLVLCSLGSDEHISGAMQNAFTLLLLVTLPVVLEPAGGMQALGIVVRPVDDTTFVVPLVFAVKRHRVSCPQ